MKQPRPTAPPGIPDGTVQLGGPIDWFSAALHISGDDLIPEQVTELLGAAPTRSQTKGVPLLRDDGSFRYTPRFGRWTRELKPHETDEWDITELIYLLFEGLPRDLATWNAIGALAKLRVSLGLSLPASNREFEFDPPVLRFLADRGVSVWFDIYDKDADEA